MSQTATSSTFFWAVISLMWSLPRPRRPMVATRMVSFGLAITDCDAAAMAAVLMTKCRRSIEFYRYRRYFITFIGFPLKKAEMLVVAISIRRARASWVAQAMCGVTRQLRA